jgi:hypothetical protein
MADTLDQIAERITTELFTNGQGQHADRLVLTQRLGSGAEADLGGWCEGAIRDRLLHALREARADALREAAMLIHETLRDLRGTHKDYKCVCGHMMSDHDISTLGSVFCPAVIQELRGRAPIGKVSQ